MSFLIFTAGWHADRLGLYRPGESQKVTIHVNSTQLAVWSLSSKFVVEPGKFSIKVGTSDQTFLNANLTVG